MKLNELKPPQGSRKDRKRVGRGQASGTGTTSGRGNKGQNSRSGGGVRPGFEGGQMPLQRRLPKRGFYNIFKTQVAEVNLRDLARFRSGTVVDEDKLKAAGVIKGRYEVIKLLGQGEIKKKLTVKVNQASKSAQAKIEAAGGKVELI